MPPQTIPSVLQPYVQDCITSHPSTTLITSVLDAPANWLILRFIAASLNGTTHQDDNKHRRSTIQNREIKISPSQPAVIFLSCFRPPSLWIELGKKIGLDFVSLATSKRLIYIDGLTATIPPGGGSTNNSIDNKLNTIKLRSLGLQDVKNAVTTAKQSLSSSVTTTTPTTTTTTTDPVSNTNRKVTIIIDGLDFLLASHPSQDNSNNISTSLNQITQFINTLHDDDNSNIMLSVSADSPLIHNVDNTTTELETGSGIFVRMLAYQCRWVYQTRSLETGRARDVDGVVRVSKGGLFEGDGEGNGNGEKELEDGEWLYQVKGDGNVRVWLRGE